MPVRAMATKATKYGQRSSASMKRPPETDSAPQAPTASSGRLETTFQKFGMPNSARLSTSALFGIPNFWNVVSNLPLLAVGAWGSGRLETTFQKFGMPNSARLSTSARNAGGS